MKAVITGTFDPITLGHIDIIKRAASMFENVTVLICDNAEKKCMFDQKQRIAMAELALQGVSNVKTDVCYGLLADYTEKNGISVIVRGIRDASDTPYEMMLATINRSLCNNPDTVFIPSKPEHSHISSSYVREMIKYCQPLDNILPEQVISYIKSL